MNTIIGVLVSLISLLSFVAKGEVLPEPPVVFRPTHVQPQERPVLVETRRETVADNGLLRRVETTVVFTNPNGRVFEGELEFPLPPGETVCGYELEVDGTMVPGVVCEKEAARMAFENEKRQGADPGLVEQVKGNVWKTRIHPLQPNVPRKAKVITVVETAPALVAPGLTVVETDGADVFVGRLRPAEERDASRADRLRKAAKATLYWDASMSRQGKTAADRNLLELLPEAGDWTLVVFRNVIEPPVRFTERAALLAAVDALVYDGGTCLAAVDRAAAPGDFVFTDERDEEAESRRALKVTKLAKGEKPPQKPEPGTLLAVAWAAARVAALSGAAEANKAELLELGRRYGVASPVTSLLVLETLEQYLRYRVEPPKTLAFHGEWERRRAAEDDPIAAAKDRADHNRRLLELWEERVRWWNDPVPPKRTPKSGLFGRVANVVRGDSAPARPMRARSMSVALTGFAPRVAEESVPVPAEAPVPAHAHAAEPAPSVPCATVKIAAWDPKTPYLTALGAVRPETAYGEYLKQRDAYGTAPSFYLDCAGWFFKAGERRLAVRIVSNLSELKLEDVGLWRTMGWRLREAEAHDEAIEAFRHVLDLRGEEPQSRRDLALVLTERGKARLAKGEVQLAANDLSEALRLLHAAAFEPAGRRSARRSNDLQTSVVALEELNGLVSWIAGQSWKDAIRPTAPQMDAAFRRDLPLALRITLSWDTDETDVDLHVLEPDGEEAYYGHRRTSSGGFVSEDVTTGYGPEEYLRKDAQKGVYRILANYFASHRQALTGAAVVTATVYTDWGRKGERRQVLSFRLDRPKDKHPIGEVNCSP